MYDCLIAMFNVDYLRFVHPSLHMMGVHMSLCGCKHSKLTSYPSCLEVRLIEVPFL
jgi:hypothetical protein